MITIIIPTRNRAYTLKKVAESYYQQKYVNEIIFVDDCGEDNTQETIEKISKNYPQITTKYIRHKNRKGAAGGRITGYTNASNDYILFCDDDEFLELNYTEVCFQILKLDENIGIVSGRRVYRNLGEKNEEALIRFGKGTDDVEPFDFKGFVFNNNAHYEKDIFLPLTNAIILTKKNLLIKYGYDPYYSNGNGYREESDYQAAVCTNGYKILVTNDTHSIHLSMKEVQTGGQRKNRFIQLYWNIIYTNYFFDKYYLKYKSIFNLSDSLMIAKIKSVWFQIYNTFLRPAKKVLFWFFK